MEEFLLHFMSQQSLVVLFIVIVVMIFILGKGADILVEEAVTLSIHWGVPKMLIGATIVSLGTTLPEAAVSVFAAIQGSPGLALGNAVGSIICDTGLILGLACVISPLPLIKNVVNRQGWIQLGAGILLVISVFPYTRPDTLFTEGGVLPQPVGFLFLVLLAAYLWLSIWWVKRHKTGVNLSATTIQEDKSALHWVILKLILGIFLVIVSSRILIPAVQETALRLHVPEGIIAATLIAFGTSLPELVTALTAVKKGHGELAVGNVIGADILNVLFVAGSAAAVTSGGLIASPHFFKKLFPAMLLILMVFRFGVIFSKDKLRRPFGIILLVIYVLITVISYDL